jgi:hypothetical protein
VNQMMPLSGQPNRFSFHNETNDRTTQVMPGYVIRKRLKALTSALWVRVSNGLISPGNR